MDVDSFASLQLLEKRIKQFIQQFKLEELLIGLRQGLDILPPFVLGGAALFAIRYCKPGQMAPNYRTLQWRIVDRLTDLVTQYQIADPLGFDESIRENYYDSNPVFTLLRIFGNQAPYSITFFGQQARPLTTVLEQSKCGRFGSDLAVNRGGVPRLRKEPTTPRLSRPNRVAVPNRLRLPQTTRCPRYHDDGVRR
jgi:hypothetical protein